MKSQYQGSTYLQEINSDGTLGVAVKICQDVLTVALATESFEHKNRCGKVPVTDYRGSKGSTASVTLSYTDLDDARFAIGALGTQNAQDSGTSNVTNEEIPAAEDGASYFLGGKERKHNITALSITDSTTVPVSLTVDTHYTLDEESGRIDFLDVEGMTLPLIADYTHREPATVSLLTAGQKEYFLSFEGWNLADSTQPVSFELYKVRFDPVSNIDLLPEEIAPFELQGSALADTDRDVSDTVFGQFGRRLNRLAIAA